MEFCFHTHTKAAERSHCSGFTLLEILIVVFIISIAVGAVGISLGSALKDSRLANEATRTLSWFNQIRHLSIIGNQTFRLIFNEPGFVIVEEFNTEAEEDQESWQEALSVDGRRFVISQGLDAKWFLQDDELQELYIYPDSSYSPFELELSLNNNDALVIIGGGIADPVLEGKEIEEAQP